MIGRRKTMIVGILGGSGLYDLEGLSGVGEQVVTTPFGAPSGPVVTGTIGELGLAFLARHGRGHRLLPSEINYRANIHALKQLGAEKVISVSAVGSLKEGLAPGDLVVVDQFIDRTHRRQSTFFGDGVVGHVSYGDPVCPTLAGALYDNALALGFAAGQDADRARAAAPGRVRRACASSAASRGARSSSTNGSGASPRRCRSRWPSTTGRWRCA